MTTSGSAVPRAGTRSRCTSPGCATSRPSGGAVREIEEVLVPLGARPHWGKVFEMGAGAIAEAFPRLGDFVDLRDRVDPDRVFGNAFLDRVLGGR